MMDTPVPTILPTKPWDWVASGTPSANGNFHIYLVDATGRKIASIYGRGPEREAMARQIVALVNGDVDVSPA